MIHSLAGGDIQEVDYSDYAKVKLLEGSNIGDIFWYKTALPNLKINDIVVVPFGYNKETVKAQVLKIDKNISSQCSPVNSKRAKYISRIIKSD